MSDFTCLSCGHTCPHRQCIWVYRTSDSYRACPVCFVPTGDTVDEVLDRVERDYGEWVEGKDHSDA